MTPDLTRREKKRMDKQLERDRKRENARLRAIAEAKRIEDEAEELAPGILREALYAGDPEKGAPMIRGPMVEIIAGRAVHGAANPRFTMRQNQAAHRLRLDWREVGTGCGVAAVDYERARGSGDGLGGHQAMLGQMKARARLEAALAFLGAFTPGIRRVVLDCVPIPVWADEAGKLPEDAVAWIRAALDRLSAFYDPPAVETVQRKGFLTFGPRRDAYEVEVGSQGD